MAKQTDAEKLKKARAQIKNLRETNRMLIAKRSIEQNEFKKTREALGNLQKTSLEEIATEFIAVYLKNITEQYGEERIDEETGEKIGKMFAFTLQEPNENKFNMMPMQDEEGRITFVCAVTFPEEEGGKDDEGQQV